MDTHSTRGSESVYHKIEVWRSSVPVSTLLLLWLLDVHAVIVNKIQIFRSPAMADISGIPETVPQEYRDQLQKFQSQIKILLQNHQVSVESVNSSTYTYNLNMLVSLAGVGCLSSARHCWNTILNLSGYFIVTVLTQTPLLCAVLDNYVDIYISRTQIECGTAAAKVQSYIFTSSTVAESYSGVGSSSSHPLPQADLIF